MRKSDYRDRRWYTPSQYRHALTILYSENVTVRGLTITNTGVSDASSTCRAARLANPEVIIHSFIAGRRG